MFCLDTVMMDIVMMVREVPQPGSDVLADKGFVTTGGGFNAMSSAARQGMAVVYAGKLGTGPFTDLAQRALQGESIDAPIDRDPIADTGFCIVIVDESAQRTFMTSRGAEAGLDSEDLSGLDVRDGDYVLISGYNVMYPGFADIVLDWIAGLNEGVIVVFDPSNRVYDIPERYLTRALSRADWLLCNEIEARHLTATDSLLKSAVALGELTRRGNAVLRHGATGCTVVSGGSVPLVIGSFATTVVDTNGAGDTHNGVFVAELADGAEIAEAARRANAASSVAISLPGPANCPTRDVIDEMMAQWANRSDG
jgi:sugar/nucleoside kinase (ribokinase family)